MRALLLSVFVHGNVFLVGGIMRCPNLYHRESVTTAELTYSDRLDIANHPLIDNDANTIVATVVIIK